MNDSRPEPAGGEWPEPDAAPAWHSFGVPHGGAPEPPPYTPAFRERLRRERESEQQATGGAGSPAAPAAPGPPAGPGGEVPDGPDLTQPIKTSATQEVTPAPTDGRSFWWTTPGSAASPEGSGAGSRPAGVTSRLPLPPPTGQPYASPWDTRTGAPAPPATLGIPGGVGGLPTTGLPGDPPPADRPRRSPPWTATAVVALVAALLGGGVVLAGQQLLDRGTSLGSAVPAPGPGSTARPAGSIAKIAADALPSVVTIRIKTAQGSGNGSGFVIDTQGHVVTNNHVVAAAGGSGEISVELNNGKTLPATIVGADASYDLAVVKVDASGIPPLQFGTSKDVVVGDGVIAVGAPLGLDATVTSGIVSALNRPVTPGDGNDQSFINAIQTDAAINPGNSGGPLLDMNGRVIGVNSAIARVPGTSSDVGGNIGVGFAIPSDQAAKTAQQLITAGKADHPALGVRVDRTYTGDGAKLASGGVPSGSAADKAGLKEGDVIVEFEGRKVTDADSLIVAVRARSVGDTVTMKVQRGNQTVDVRVTLQSATG